MQDRLSKVNFKKLVRDLADMYQDDTFDVVVAELVANALDAHSGQIDVSWDASRSILVVLDDGDGMNAEAFEQYHDFAAELKTRGQGIGFAGVGAKISFNIANRVVTETRQGNTACASDWRWHDDGTLLWNSVSPSHLHASGTRVEVHFNHDDVPTVVDSAYLENVLKRHYLPLFIGDFVSAYTKGKLYPTCPNFSVNGVPLPPGDLSNIAALTQAPVKFPLGSGSADSKGWGAIGVSDRECPLGNGAYGLLLCTHGKVIKQELFGLSTGMLGARLFGIVEMPGLINYLTTNKSDLRGGPGRGRDLNQMIAPIKEQLKKFLAQHGVTTAEPQSNSLSKKLERELTKMVKKMPELQDFDGLLRRSRSLRKSEDGDVLTSETQSRSENPEHRSKSEEETDGGNSGGSSRVKDKVGKTPAKLSRSRRNQGPRIGFEEHTDRQETAWLSSDTIIINSGHTAYQKQTSNAQASLTYCMFAIGVALDKADLVALDEGVSYVDKFITFWGEQL